MVAGKGETKAFSKSGMMVKKFPRDLDIFSVFTFTNPLCTQNLLNWSEHWSQDAMDCASSFSWWGKVRSSPPPWMSISSPRSL